MEARLYRPARGRQDQDGALSEKCPYCGKAPAPLRRLTSRVYKCRFCASVLQDSLFGLMLVRAGGAAR